MVGDVVDVALGDVKPNDWNMNELTESQLDGLRRSFQKHGWLKSEAMLIWGKDDKGKVRNTIINGEHRRAVGIELGMNRGPAVILNGLTRAQAISLTIKLDSPGLRGSPNNDRLAAAIREIMPGIELSDLSLDLGYDQSFMKRLLEQMPAHPPAEFRSVDITAETHYQCPNCKYEWNGDPSPAKKKE